MPRAVSFSGCCKNHLFAFIMYYFQPFALKSTRFTFLFSTIRILYRFLFAICLYTLLFSTIYLLYYDLFLSFGRSRNSGRKSSLVLFAEQMRGAFIPSLQRERPKKKIHKKRNATFSK